MGTEIVCHALNLEQQPAPLLVQVGQLAATLAEEVTMPPRAQAPTDGPIRIPPDRRAYDERKE